MKTLTLLLLAVLCAASLSAAQQTVNEGSKVTLSVTFKGGILQPGSTVPDQSTGHTFQWFKNGQAITGATAKEHIITAATVADVGNYTVRITNAAGTTLSDTAALSLLVTPKDAATAIASQSAAAGTSSSP